MNFRMIKSHTTLNSNFRPISISILEAQGWTIYQFNVEYTMHTKNTKKNNLDRKV